MLGYFRFINTLGFIPLSAVLCNSFQIYSEAFSHALGFFLQRFTRKSGVFLYFRLFYCAIDLNKRY